MSSCKEVFFGIIPKEKQFVEKLQKALEEYGNTIWHMQM